MLILIEIEIEIKLTQLIDEQIVKTNLNFTRAMRDSSYKNICFTTVIISTAFDIVNYAY